MHNKAIPSTKDVPHSIPRIDHIEKHASHFIPPPGLIKWIMSIRQKDTFSTFVPDSIHGATTQIPERRSFTGYGEARLGGRFCTAQVRGVPQEVLPTRPQGALKRTIHRRAGGILDDTVLTRDGADAQSHSDKDRTPAYKLEAIARKNDHSSTSQ